jgi:hypothetical protein
VRFYSISWQFGQNNRSIRRAPILLFRLLDGACNVRKDSVGIRAYEPYGADH